MDGSDHGSSFVAARIVGLVAALGSVALLLLSTGAPTLAAPVSAPGAMSGTVDLTDDGQLTAQFGFEPPTPEDMDPASYYAGIRSAALLGDVDGDKIGDMAFGDPNADPRGRANAGSVYVVFGRLRDATPGAGLKLASLGDRGYRIDGPASGARLGASLAALGDDDGDGVAEFAIGAPLAADSATPTRRTGAVYIIRGDKLLRTDERPAADIDLAEAHPKIAGLLGAGPGDRAGTALAALPTGPSGRSGLIIGAPFADPPSGADPPSRANAGSVYVLAQTLPLPRSAEYQLAGLPASYRIDGADAGDRAGSAVGASADMSGDGLAEVLVGAPDSGPGSAADGFAGAAFVVAARPIGGVVDLAAPAGEGMTIRGEPGMRLGDSILGLGDLSGDGVPDIAIGAPTASPGGRSKAGSVFVVHGAASAPAIQLPVAADGPTRLDGARPLDRFGSRLALVGNRDPGDVADLLVAAPRVDALGRQNAGAVYVLRGVDVRAGRADIALLGRSGVRLVGGADREYAGSALAGGLGAGGGAETEVLVAGRSAAALLDRPEIPPAIAPRPPATCPLVSNIEIVVDDSSSMVESDAKLLRRAAIDQMLSKPRDAPIRLGAIEFGKDAVEIFPPLAIERAGLGQPAQAPELMSLRGLLDERIHNDAGSTTDYAAGLLAATRHNPGADALLLITDAAVPEPPAPLTDPGRPVYVLELPSRRYGKRAREALLKLTRATRGQYFAAVGDNDAALPAALGIVEASLRCEQTLTTEVFKAGEPVVATERAPLTDGVVETKDVIAETTATPNTPAIFETGLPRTTDVVTLTLSYLQAPIPRALRDKLSCLRAAPVSLRSVRVSGGGAADVVASAAQLNRALRGLPTPIGRGLNARGSCGRGYMTLRITGLQHVPLGFVGALAARGAETRNVTSKSALKARRKAQELAAAAEGKKKKKKKRRK